MPTAMNSWPGNLIQPGNTIQAELAVPAGDPVLEPRSKVLDCTFSGGLHSIRHPVRVE
jgi:hypothetical protein